MTGDQRDPMSPTTKRKTALEAISETSYWKEDGESEFETDVGHTVAARIVENLNRHGFKIIRNPAEEK